MALSIADSSARSSPYKFDNLTAEFMINRSRGLTAKMMKDGFIKDPSGVVD